MTSFRGMTGAAGGSLRWFDRITTGGIALLVLGTPIAIGSVHLWAYRTMELIIFGLAIVWMLRLWMEGAAPARMSIPRQAFRRLVIPAAMALSFIGLQLVPLPPRVIGLLSPATYRLYAMALPGWPAESPYRGLIVAWEASLHPQAQPELQVALPPVGSHGSARAQAAEPQTVAKRMPPKTLEETKPAAPGLLGRMTWRPLSIAPFATWSGLIQLAAYGTLFFIVLLYPFGFAGAGLDAQRRFFRALIIIVLASGTIVAMLGIAEHGWWNGKILWVFVPQDWTGPLAVNPRASGPFVNADHFADYLVMVLPLALIGALFPIMPGFRHKRSSDVQLACAIAGVVIASAIMMSLSRAGWAVAIIGMGVALGLCVVNARDELPAALRGLGLKMLPIAVGGAVVMLLVLLFLAGPSGRSQASVRIAATITSGQDLSYKPALWRDTLRLVGDFPLFGAGLGCWPEIFPHYQRAPWMNSFFFREPENDYLQFLAETGLIGFALAAWFAWTIVARLHEGAARLKPRDWPLFAGIAAGLGAALIHEFVDFNLQTPANMVLFTVLLAALLRLALTKGAERPDGPGLRSVSAPSSTTFAKAALMAGAAAVLMVLAAYQRDVAYPFDVKEPKSFAGAEAAMTTHPARASTHIALAALMPIAAPSALVREQLKAAVWLDPNDPFGRDLYARSLFLTGNKQEGLRQIELSVFHAPALSAHFYLEPRMIPWLLPEEQKAIADGLIDAIGAHYGYSAEQLAQFYGSLGRNHDAAVICAAAAASSKDPEEKTAYLINAGQYYAKAQDLKSAREVLTQAASIDVTDPRPIGELIVGVLGPEKNIAAARTLVEQGIERGGDPAGLYLALAQAAREAGDPVTVDDALNQVMNHEPTFDMMMAAGQIYAAEGSYDRAALTFEHATEMDQQSANAFFQLAAAEEGAYEYGLASRDYARAIALNPGDDSMRARYAEFQRRTAESAADQMASPPADQKLPQAPGG
ncbi:MAG: O-antigen ligase family protein [Candidatus Binataceae bacterium]|jgi:tetratricopeptide (TPR) repeat protein